MRKSNATLWVAYSVLTAFAQRPTQPSANQAPAAIGGEVRNSVTGMPIERAHVVARPTNSQQRYGAFTDTEGKFTITGLPSGDFVIAVDRVGYVTSTSHADATINLQPGDKKADLKLKLTPTGAIVGRVLDADGQPMEGVMVSVEIGGRPDRSASTDDRGMFRIGGLRPGKVRVRAQTMRLPFPPEIRTDGTVEVHYSPTYHPNALDANSAIRVEIGPATEVTGVDIRMVRTALIRVSGKVIGIPPGAKNTFLMVQPHGPGAQVKPDGSFEMWRVDPGKYTVTAQVNPQGGFGQFVSPPIPLEVGDSDVENLQIRLLPVGDLKGQVIFEDEEARTPPTSPAPVRRVMLRGDGNQSTPNGELKEDGSFTLARVSPAHYQVSVPGKLYVKSMTLGPTNFDGAKLDLTTGVPDAPLVLHVAASKGVVSGVVSDAKGPVAGVHVAIAEESLERGFTQGADTRDDGSYSFGALAPGKYRLFLFEDDERDELMMSLQRFDDIAEKIEVRDRETVTKDLKRK